MTKTKLLFRQKIVAYWLLTGALSIVIQVLLGGITRITESGLSITEWNPVMGALPPLGEDEWMVLFEKYQLTDQYQHLKFHISLSEFKDIFFWEWLHRNWARGIGFLFLLPYLFWRRAGYFSPTQNKRYLLLFVLGLLQAVMGWLMVRSGLKEGNLYVEHTFLTMHFILAVSTLALCVYYALDILIPSQAIVYHSLYRWHWVLLVLVSLQLIYGAFMAGLRAATVAPTWPKINNEWIPSTLWTLRPLLANLLYNKVLVQWIHRSLAYMILLVAVCWFYKSQRVIFKGHIVWRHGLVLLLIFQILVGVFTVLVSPDYAMMRFPAVLHQFIGMLIFMWIFVLCVLVRKPLTSLPSIKK